MFCVQGVFPKSFPWASKERVLCGFIRTSREVASLDKGTRGLYQLRGRTI